MKPVDQTTFGVPGGNCFSACVASLLELPIEAVPYFMTDTAVNHEALAGWLRSRGLYAVTCRFGGPEDTWRPAGLYILGGESPRGPHAVVARGGEVVHDPHPSRAGLVIWEDATLLIPLDPAKGDGRT